MYTITDTKSNLVTEIGLTRQEAVAITSKGGHRFHLQADYEVTPKVSTYKYDATLHTFVLLNLDEIRVIRDDKLKDSDWRVTLDYPGTKQQEWIDYRKELRDLPQKFTTVEDVVMPLKPEGD